jgi:hypothetical protein
MSKKTDHLNLWRNSQKEVVKLTNEVFRLRELIEALSPKSRAGQKLPDYQPPDAEI